MYLIHHVSAEALTLVRGCHVNR